MINTADLNVKNCTGVSLIISMSPETHRESRTKRIDLHYSIGIADVEREIEIQLRTRRQQFFRRLCCSFSTSRTCLASSTIVFLVFFRIPSLSGRSFCAARFYSTGARRITRRVVCDNDNQRVKWGLIFFRRGGKWRRRETRMTQGRERRKENACIHLPRNTQACTQHRRILCGLSSTEKGTKGGRRGRKERRETSERASLDGDTRISRARPHHL